MIEYAGKLDSLSQNKPESIRRISVVWGIFEAHRISEGMMQDQLGDRSV